MFIFTNLLKALVSDSLNYILRLGIERILYYLLPYILKYAETSAIFGGGVFACVLILTNTLSELQPDTISSIKITAKHFAEDVIESYINTSLTNGSLGDFLLLVIVLIIHKILNHQIFND